MGKPRNTQKYPTYPEIPEIPGNTRKKKKYLEIPDRIFRHSYPNPTRYPVFCPIPDPTQPDIEKLYPLGTAEERLCDCYFIFKELMLGSAVPLPMFRSYFLRSCITWERWDCLQAAIALPLGPSSAPKKDFFKCDHAQKVAVGFNTFQIFPQMWPCPFTRYGVLHLPNISSNVIMLKKLLWDSTHAKHFLRYNYDHKHPSSEPWLDQMLNTLTRAIMVQKLVNVVLVTIQVAHDMFSCPILR